MPLIRVQCIIVYTIERAERRNNTKANVNQCTRRHVYILHSRDAALLLVNCGSRDNRERVPRISRMCSNDRNVINFRFASRPYKRYTPLLDLVEMCTSRGCVAV